MPGQRAAAQVALFSPYLGGISRQEELAAALEILSNGIAEGERSVEGRAGHRYRLSWQPGLTPLDSVSCELALSPLARNSTPLLGGLP